VSSGSQSLKRVKSPIAGDRYEGSHNHRRGECDRRTERRIPDQFGESIYDQSGELEGDQADIPSGLQPNALLAPQQVEDQPADQPRQGGQGALPSQWPDSVSPTPTRGGSSLRRR
jgi:hypothetical protein